MLFEAPHMHLMLFGSILWIHEARLVQATQKQIKTIARMIRSLIEHCPYILSCETSSFRCFTPDLNTVVLFWGS